VNLTGVFLTFREAMRGMAPGGRLIALASTAEPQGRAGGGGLCAPNTACLGWCGRWRIEVAKSGITCNAVCPGYVDTRDGRGGGQRGLTERLGISEAEAMAKVTGGNPMGRLITTDEVVAAVMFLASPGSVDGERARAVGLWGRDMTRSAHREGPPAALAAPAQGHAA
jgi:3-hydroxybutyrate dehydrogenase